MVEVETLAEVENIYDEIEIDDLDYDEDDTTLDNSYVCAGSLYSIYNL
jgi:hypothetical protein